MKLMVMPIVTQLLVGLPRRTEINVEPKYHGLCMVNCIEEVLLVGDLATQLVTYSAIKKTLDCELTGEWKEFNFAIAEALT